MNRYCAVTGYKKGKGKASGVMVALTMFAESDGQFKPIDRTIVKLSSINEVAKVCVNGVLPLNFSISNGKLVEDAGSFSRFDVNYPMYIVLNEVRQKRSKNIIGYTLYNCTNGGIKFYTKAEIFDLSRSIASKVGSKELLPIIQNAILRSNGVISNFEGRNYSVLYVDRNKGNKSNKKSVRRSGDKYSKKAESLFGDTSFLVEGLDNQQKDVLIRAKDNGALVEYFNNPAIPSDVMKVYGEAITSKEMAKICKPIYSNPKLNKQQVESLINGAYMGAEISSMCDENISVSELDMYMSKERSDLWQDIPRVPMRDEELELAVAYSMQRLMA